MRIRTLVFVAATAVGWMVMSNCSSSNASCAAGSETCPCYGNGTCDDGLACRSEVCVDLGSTGAGGSTGVGGSSSGGLDVQACLACAESQCPTSSMACKAVSGCEDILKCLVGCNKDATCLSKCNAGASSDANMKSLAYQTCAFTGCPNECIYSGSSTGAGGATGSGGAGGSSALPTCATCDLALACCLAVAPGLGLQPKDCGYYSSSTCTLNEGQARQMYANNCRDLLKSYEKSSPTCQQ